MHCFNATVNNLLTISNSSERKQRNENPLARGRMTTLAAFIFHFSDLELSPVTFTFEPDVDTVKLDYHAKHLCPILFIRKLLSGYTQLTDCSMRPLTRGKERKLFIFRTYKVLGKICDTVIAVTRQSMVGVAHHWR